MIIDSVSEQCALSLGIKYTSNINRSVSTMMPSIIPISAFEEFGKILYSNSAGKTEPTFFKINEIVAHSSGAFLEILVDCAVFTNNKGIPSLVHFVSTKMRPLDEHEIPFIGKTIIPKIEVID
jgi:hypothetical protein